MPRTFGIPSRVTAHLIAFGVLLMPVGVASAFDDGSTGSTSTSASTVVTSAAPTAVTFVATPWLAEYDGVTIDLRTGWSTAKACHSNGRTTDCFDTESEMNAVLGLTDVAAAPVPTFIGFKRVSCTSTVRLYTGTGFTGTVLALSTRLTVLNLSTYGFNNVTTSYRVGACAAAFYDGASAGLPVYPGGTGAGQQASSMLAGWDNRISSIYIA